MLPLLVRVSTGWNLSFQPSFSQHEWHPAKDWELSRISPGVACTNISVQVGETLRGIGDGGKLHLSLLGGVPRKCHMQPAEIVSSSRVSPSTDSIRQRARNAATAPCCLAHHCMASTTCCQLRATAQGMKHVAVGKNLAFQEHHVRTASIS